MTADYTKMAPRFVTARRRLQLTRRRFTVRARQALFDMDTWRSHIAAIRPYTLPVAGLSTLSVGVAQFGTGPGLITAGLGGLLVEYDRRVRRAAEGREP